MDHFVGFDRLLRIHLHRTPILRIYGPAGFLKQVEGKLRGYTWNLTEGYPLSILAFEAEDDLLKTAAFCARNGFSREDLECRHWNRNLLEEAGFRVTAALLDHGTPCLGFRVEEKMRVQILSEELQRRGFIPGPWLSTLKTSVVCGDPPSRKIRVKTLDGVIESTLGELMGIYRLAPGAALAYIVDVADNPQNVKRIVTLAQKVDLLYIEAAFMAGDHSLATARNHLTAGSAGQIAALTSATRTKLIHISPRYEGREDELLREARKAAGSGGKVEGGW